jgi:hypothetical protein
MVERARREPTMEEIVVALRETTRDADRVHPFAVTAPSRGKRIAKGISGGFSGEINNPSDIAELRDGEVERLLQENARLNARVVSLLKVLEHQQAVHAESVIEQTAETTRIEVDRGAVLGLVRTAVEAELAPILLVVLRLLEKRRVDPGVRDSGPGAGNREATRGPGTDPAAYSSPSDWLVDLMRRAEDLRVEDPRQQDGVPPNDKVTAAGRMPQRSKLRELMAQVLNALSLEPNADAPRRRYSPDEGRR